MTSYSKRRSRYRSAARKRDEEFKRWEKIRDAAAESLVSDKERKIKKVKGAKPKTKRPSRGGSTPPPTAI